MNLLPAGLSPIGDRCCRPVFQGLPRGIPMPGQGGHSRPGQAHVWHRGATTGFCVSPPCAARLRAAKRFAGSEPGRPARCRDRPVVTAGCARAPSGGGFRSIGPRPANQPCRGGESPAPQSMPAARVRPGSSHGGHRGISSPPQAVIRQDGEKMKRAALLAVFLFLAGCGTIAGIGEDIQAGARTVQSWF